MVKVNLVIFQEVNLLRFLVIIMIASNAMIACKLFSCLSITMFTYINK